MQNIRESMSLDVVHLLPDSVANQIAAGEVIQRPASCLKELLENSLDAGAHHISILIRDAGKSLIQVTDDGVGMSRTDARMAFERHATSKISQASDLMNLHTMGFRGEALPSIVAVAQVSLATRRAEDELGTNLEIHGSEVLHQEPCQCGVGTTIKVKNLFFNVPARRRFLKSDQTEMRNLIQTFQHVALVYPEVAFTFVSDDEILYDLTSGTRKQRIENIFGKSISKTFTSKLLDISSDTELINITGFIGKPESAAKNAEQFFFVNGRYMRHPYFHKAVLQAYQGMLQPDHTPPYFIYFDVNPADIDVNVHPTKTEIKFANEQAIFPILVATARQALGRFNIVPSIDFQGGSIDLPTNKAGTNSPVRPPQMSMSSGYNPFKVDYGEKQRVNGWEQLYSTMHDESIPLHSDDSLAYPNASSTPHITDDHAAYLTESATKIQVGHLIVVAGGEDMILIHARRAHVKILYSEILHQLSTERGISQQLLFTEALDLGDTEMSLLDEMHNDLEHIGFRFQGLGLNSGAQHSHIEMTAVPALLANKNAISALQDLLHRAADNASTVHEQLRETIALSLAKSAAIPAGKILSKSEMDTLVKQLLECDENRRLPDGKTIITTLSAEELSRRF